MFVCYNPKELSLHIWTENMPRIVYNYVNLSAAKLLSEIPLYTQSLSAYHHPSQGLP